MSSPVFDSFRRDLRDAIRSFRRTPAFSVTAILTLGLGIGLSSAIFTAFREIALKRLPVFSQDEIFELSGSAKGAKHELGLLPDMFRRFRHDSRALQGVAGFSHWGAVQVGLVDGDRQLVLRQAIVSGNFFQVLGAVPAAGRLFVPEDDPNFASQALNYDASAAVLSHATWRRWFGADPAAVGRHLRVLGNKWNVTVVGVAPAGLDYPSGVDFWVANTFSEIDLVARLANGATKEAGRAEYLSFIKNEPEYIKAGLVDQVGARIEPISEMVVGNVRPAIRAMTAAVAILLILTCVNVANLVLLRVFSRRREVAVRRALGAESSDIGRQFVVESAAIGAMGGLIGLAVAQSLLKLLPFVAPPGLPRLEMIRVAPAPVMLTGLVTLITVLVVGLIATLGSPIQDLTADLRADSHGSGQSRQFGIARRTLVALQMALALVLLAAAGLLLRSFGRLSGLDVGFGTIHVAIIETSMPWEKWIAPCGGVPPAADSALNKKFGDCTDAFMVQYNDQVVSQLHLLRGVEKASPVAVTPLLGTNIFATPIRSETQSESEATSNPWVGFETVGPEYFEALGLPILRGRGFTDADRHGSMEVAIVTEAVATRLWPGQDPVGKRVRQSGNAPLWTVVGVVPDIHFREYRHATPMVIRPYRQVFAQGTFVARFRGTLPTLMPSLKDAIHSVDRAADLINARTMDDVIAPELAQPRLNAVLLSTFAFTAIILAVLGLYGVMAASVAQKTRELGVRMALGATAQQVRHMILGQAAAIAGVGALCGLAAALAGSRFLSSVLFEVSATDPVTLIGVSFLLMGIALLAAYSPARRATKIDPARALRAD